MACTVFQGADFTLVGQTEATYRTAPTTPGATQLKFSQLNLNRNPVRQVDPTITDTVLVEKTDEIDESPEGSITSIACLSDALFWFTLLFGAPVTTGTGPYVHTFTLTKECKPSALLELKGVRSSTTRIRRFLGCMIRDFSWDIMSEDQNFVMNLIMATMVSPNPSTAFDTTPTKLAKARAMPAKGLIYDVSGASTLGQISGASLSVNLDPQPQKLADGRFGYGAVLPGQTAFTGTINALFEETGLASAAESHTSKKLVIETEAKNGETIELTIPSAEFSEPANEVTTRQGIVRPYNWMAHHKDGDAPITLVLTNSIASL